MGQTRYPRRHYRAYSNLSGRDQARRHIDETNDLHAKYCHLYEAVRAEFFAMPEPMRNKLLAEYRLLWGQKAFEYATETIPKWQRGSVHSAVE